MDIIKKEFVSETKEVENETTLEVVKELGIGKNGTKIVKYDGSTIGFFKNSALTTNGLLDDWEYFISVMGREILGFDLAKVCRVFNKENESMGIISENVAGENEELMMFSNVLDVLLDSPSEELMITAAKIKEIRRNNMQHFKSSSNGEDKTFVTLSDENDIAQIVDMFPTALNELNISPQEKDAMLHKYFEMIVMDLLIGQKDRNNDNYGILYNKETKETRFSPLFDNATIYMPLIPETHNQLNGCLMEREKLMTVLVTRYPEYTMDIITPIVENKEEIYSRTQTLSERVLGPEKSKHIMGNIRENLTSLDTIVKENTNKK